MHKLKGFTLLELILVMIIIGIIAAASTQPLMQGLQSYTSSQDINTLDIQANYALERMTRIIRSIPVSSSITTATSFQLTFNDNANVNYSYSLSGGNLVESSNILSGNATGLSFTYYNSSGNATTTVSAIRFVKIGLTLAKNNFTYTYSTTVNLPNLF